MVKLTDLGLSREVDTQEFRVTRAGTTVGTVDYIARRAGPRQRLRPTSAATSYLLGCTWFHMLTGRPPFPEGGLAERLCKHMNDEPPDVAGWSTCGCSPRDRGRAAPPAGQGAAPTATHAGRPSQRPRNSQGRRSFADRHAALQLGLLNDDGDGSAYARTAGTRPRRPRRPRAVPGVLPAGKPRLPDHARRRPVPRACEWYILGGGAAALLAAVAVGLRLRRPGRTAYFLSFGSGGQNHVHQQYERTRRSAAAKASALRIAKTRRLPN